MHEAAQLSRTDVLIERPFTHPEHAYSDLAILHNMLDELRIQHGQILPDHPATESSTYHFPRAEGYQKRVIIFQPHRLFDTTPLTVIGFFGQRSMPRDIDLEGAIFDVGHELLADLYLQPGIISYSTTMLADCYNYANLVLLDSDEYIEQWRQNVTHQEVNDALSPHYYANVRIYNGRLTPAGLSHRPSIDFVHVKYFDYQSSQFWRGIRALGQSCAA